MFRKIKIITCVVALHFLMVACSEEAPSGKLLVEEQKEVPDFDCTFKIGKEVKDDKTIGVQNYGFHVFYHEEFAAIAMLDADILKLDIYRNPKKVTLKGRGDNKTLQEMTNVAHGETNWEGGYGLLSYNTGVLDAENNHIDISLSCETVEPDSGD